MEAAEGRAGAAERALKAQGRVFESLYFSLERNVSVSEEAPGFCLGPRPFSFREAPSQSFPFQLSVSAFEG